MCIFWSYKQFPKTARKNYVFLKPHSIVLKMSTFDWHENFEWKIGVFFKTNHFPHRVVNYQKFMDWARKL